jgi:hypothetical protein
MKVTVTNGKKPKTGSIVTLNWKFFVVEIPAMNAGGKIFVRKVDNPAVQFMVDPSEVTKAK